MQEKMDKLFDSDPNTPGQENQLLQWQQLIKNNFNMLIDKIDDLNLQFKKTKNMQENLT